MALAGIPYLFKKMKFHSFELWIILNYVYGTFKNVFLFETRNVCDTDTIYIRMCAVAVQFIQYFNDFARKLRCDDQMQSIARLGPGSSVIDSKFRRSFHFQVLYFQAK